MRNRTENQIDFYVIRHGATRANEESRYLGLTDEPLSEKGILQMRALKEYLRELSVDGVLTSPLGRCRQSAEILFPGMPVCEVSLWREIDFGEFEYKNYKELNGNREYQAWIDSGGRRAFPGGESREDFIQRVVLGMDDAAGYLRENAVEKAAAVVHGGTIMALLSHFCGGGYFDYQVKNAGGYHCLLILGRAEMKMEIREAL